MENYKGVIIEESLENTDVFVDFHPDIKKWKRQN